MKKKFRKIGEILKKKWEKKEGKNKEKNKSKGK